MNGLCNLCESLIPDELINLSKVDWLSCCEDSNFSLHDELTTPPKVDWLSCCEGSNLSPHKNIMGIKFFFSNYVNNCVKIIFSLNKSEIDIF